MLFAVKIICSINLYRHLWSIVGRTEYTCHSLSRIHLHSVWMDEGESNLLAGRQRAGIYRDSCDIYYARLLINVPFHYLKIKFLYI